VVIPCFNEARRLDSGRFTTFAQSSELKLLFVDDGSADETAEILAEMAVRCPDQLEFLRLDSNSGKGEAVRIGLLAAIAQGAAIAAYLDADLSTPLDEIERLIEAVEREEVDVVLGSRVALFGHDIRRSLTRHYLGRLFATAASISLGVHVYDTQCGAKAFRVSPALRQALDQPFGSRWAFDVELIARLLASKPDPRFLEVPLKQWVDVGGSKLSSAQMLRAGLDLLRLRRARRNAARTY
jgi:glycosyltransferase involved in cell wall biosynthesis